MRLILGLWLTFACATPAIAQSTTFYDKSGNRTGSIGREGSRDVVRDKSGNARSYYEQQGSATFHCDMSGNRLGSSKPCC